MDFLSGVVSGLAGLVGAGQYYNPLGDASSELNGIKQGMNDLTTIRSIENAEEVEKQINNLVRLSKLSSDRMTNINAEMKEFMDDSLKNENLFILFCYLLIFILVFFFLIQKKCC